MGQVWFHLKPLLGEGSEQPLAMCLTTSSHLQARQGARIWDVTYPVVALLEQGSYQTCANFSWVAAKTMGIHVPCFFLPPAQDVGASSGTNSAHPAALLQTMSGRGITLPRTRQGHYLPNLFLQLQPNVVAGREQ